jgi:hypothetical protein
MLAPREKLFNDKVAEMFKKLSCRLRAAFA